MKKTISLVLSVIMLLSVSAGLDFSALAVQREFTLDDKINNKSYTFTVTDEDYNSGIYDFVSEKLGVNADDIYITLGYLCSRSRDRDDANYTNDTVSEYIDFVDSLKNDGYDVNGEIIIDNIWSTGDNYNKYWLGNYDEVNEYHIKTAYDLAALYRACYVDRHTFEGKTVYIDNDIDLSEHYWMVSAFSVPEEEYEYPPFSGVLDGNKNMIYGVRFYPIGGGTVGLLPNIKNAVIKDLYVYGEAKRANVTYFGFIAGYAKDSAILNCYAQGTIECVGRDKCYNVGAVGALVGETHHCAIINCGVNAHISLDYEHLVEHNYSVTYPRIGSLIGRATNDEEDSYCIINSFAHGKISINDYRFETYVGGFVGNCDDDIYNCYTDVEVIENGHNQNTGAVMGKIIAERSVKVDSENYQVLGEYIVDNLYCEKGTKNPIGTIESQSEKTVNDFIKYYENGSELLHLLNGGVSGADDIINAHRDILYDSSWADLVKLCGGDDIEACSWKMNTERNMPELDICYHHEYTENVIAPTTTSNQFTVYTCKHCSKSYTIENEGTKLIDNKNTDSNEAPAPVPVAPNQSKAIITGWVTIGKKRYYYDKNGVMHKGWLTYKGKKYYFNKNGVMKTGWLKKGNKRYYFNKNGVMHKGWLKYKGKKYYFKKNGIMKTGWLKKGKKRYYFKQNGVMLKNTSKKIKGKTYSFNSKGICITK